MNLMIKYSSIAWIADEDDWLNAHIKKVKAVEDAKELFNQLENNQKIEERIQKALRNLTVERKRKLLSDQDIKEENNDEIDDVGYINLFPGRCWNQEIILFLNIGLTYRQFCKTLRGELSICTVWITQIWLIGLCQFIDKTVMPFLLEMEYTEWWRSLVTQ